jgi:peptidyl-prolyl cis-trans isomerase SurA
MLTPPNLYRALTGTLLAMSLTTASHAAEGILLDGIAAVVNEDVISLSELEQSVVEVRQQIAESGSSPPPESVLRRQVLDQLIGQQLQVQIAERAGVQIPDDVLNQMLGQIAERNGMTLNQFPARLAARGVDYRRYREQLRREMMIDRVRRAEVDASVYVSPEEIDGFLAQQGGVDQDVEYKLLHILLPVAPTATDAQAAEIGELAASLVEQARSGADFRQLAVSNSAGQRALQGGDLGWRRRDQMPTMFTRALSPLQPGQITDPIRSPSGFHLLKLEDQRRGDVVLTTQSLVRHILIQPNEIVSNSDAHSVLEQLREQIIAGEVTFEEAARQYSNDPVSSSRGGDLGWNGPGTFLAEFEAVVDAIPVQQISEVFQTQFGWHILEVLDRRQYDGTEEFLRNQARSALYQQKVEESTQLWLQQLRDEAYVEIRI